jgi:hypothetical protein
MQLELKDVKARIERLDQLARGLAKVGSARWTELREKPCGAGLPQRRARPPLP